MYFKFIDNFFVEKEKLLGFLMWLNNVYSKKIFHYE